MISHFELSTRRNEERDGAGGEAAETNRDLDGVDFIYFLVIRLFPVTARGGLTTTVNGMHLYRIYVYIYIMTYSYYYNIIHKNILLYCFNCYRGPRSTITYDCRDLNFTTSILIYC